MTAEASAVHIDEAARMLGTDRAKLEGLIIRRQVRPTWSDPTAWSEEMIVAARSILNEDLVRHVRPRDL